MYPEKVLNRLLNEFIGTNESKKLLKEKNYELLADKLINFLFTKMSNEKKIELKNQYIEIFKKHDGVV